MAKKPAATREFRAPERSSGTQKRTQTSVAYRTARVARERQKREIEQQKREKLIFALFVVVILVMIIFAILIFKKVVGPDLPANTDTPDTVVTDPATEGSTNAPDTDPQIDSFSVSIETSAAKSGSLIIVDSEHKLSTKPTLKLMSEARNTFGTSASGKPVYSYYVISTPSTTCESEALEAFVDLADAFYKATKSEDLFVNKAYADEQNAHGAGLAFDLKFYPAKNTYLPLDDSDYTDEYAWLKSNCYKYGFVFDTAAGHEFCLRYVGTPHAYYINSHSLTLTRYIELLKNDVLAFTCDNGEKYEVQYLPASGDIVNVELPSDDAEYTVSGDNAGGIIVAVKIK
jgi:hypothetical protein